MKRVLHVLALLSCASTAAGATIPLQPSSHDFGKVAVNGSLSKLFTLSIPSGARQGDVLSVSLTGAAASEFFVASAGSATNDCVVDQPWSMSMQSGATCLLAIAFSPKSLGPKSATAVVSDGSGNRGTVALTGQGVAPLCEMKVVFCNYAHLYSGTFTWQITLLAPGASDVTNVNVNVINGKAACSGSQVSTRVGTDTSRSTILGVGLIAVEFVQDPLYPVAYKISVACPTSDEPAALGRGVSMESPNEPAKAVADDLDGNINYPAPETDPVNNVTGTVQIGWTLTK